MTSPAILHGWFIIGIIWNTMGYLVAYPRNIWWLDITSNLLENHVIHLHGLHLHLLVEKKTWFYG